MLTSVLKFITWLNVVKAVYMRDKLLAIITKLSFLPANKVSQPGVGFSVAVQSRQLVNLFRNSAIGSSIRAKVNLFFSVRALIF